MASDEEDNTFSNMLDMTLYEMGRLDPWRDDPIKSQAADINQVDDPIEAAPLDDLSKLDPSTYCSCGHCSTMLTLEESFCCRSKMKSSGKQSNLVSCCCI